MLDGRGVALLRELLHPAGKQVGVGQPLLLGHRLGTCAEQDDEESQGEPETV